jgi:hypothetical protein
MLSLSGTLQYSGRWGEVLPQVTVEFEEAYAREHLKQRKQVSLLLSGRIFLLSLLYNSLKDCMLLPHSIGAESTLNHSVSFLWLLSLFLDDHVLKVCCLVSLSFLVELFLVFSCFVVAFPCFC